MDRCPICAWLFSNITKFNIPSLLRQLCPCNNERETRISFRFLSWMIRKRDSVMMVCKWINALRTRTCPHPGAVHTKGRSSPISEKCSAKERKTEQPVISFIQVWIGRQSKQSMLKLLQYNVILVLPEYFRGFKYSNYFMHTGLRPLTTNTPKASGWPDDL